MVIYKVFEEKYGDKVTDKAIQKKFDDAKNKWKRKAENSLMH